jgi:hypothetical protein
METRIANFSSASFAPFTWGKAKADAMSLLGSPFRRESPEAALRAAQRHWSSGYY